MNDTPELPRRRRVLALQGMEKKAGWHRGAEAFAPLEGEGYFFIAGGPLWEKWPGNSEELEEKGNEWI